MCIVIESPSDLEQTLRKRVVGNGRIRPDGIDEFSLADDAPVMLHQIRKNIEGLWPQRHFYVPAPEAAPVEVEAEVIEAVLARRRVVTNCNL